MQGHQYMQQHQQGMPRQWGLYLQMYQQAYLRSGALGEQLLLKLLSGHALHVTHSACPTHQRLTRRKQQQYKDIHI